MGKALRGSHVITTSSWGDTILEVAPVDSTPMGQRAAHRLSEHLLAKGLRSSMAGFHEVTFRYKKGLQKRMVRVRIGQLVGPTDRVVAHHLFDRK